MYEGMDYNTDFQNNYQNNDKYSQTMQPQPQQPYPPNKPITQQLLLNNPQLTTMLHQIHRQQEQYSLLQFIKRQQIIMKQQLVFDKIPYVLANVNKLQQSIQERRNYSEDIKNQIIQMRSKIGKKRKNIEELCMEKRDKINKCKTLHKEINQLRSKYGNMFTYSSDKQQFSKQQIDGQYLQQDNKQNQSNQNNIQNLQKSKIRQINNSVMNGSQVQILNLVDIRTKNAILSRNIEKMKQLVTSKIAVLNKLKLNKEKQMHKTNGTKVVNRQGKREESSRNGSVAKSQYVSIQQTSIEGGMRS